MTAIVAKRAQCESLLSKVEFLAGLDTNEKANIADALEPCSFSDGEVLIEQGTVGEYMYFISKGSAKAAVKQLDTGASVVIKEYGPGGHFGELTLINNNPHLATVVAGPGCECYSLSRSAYSRLALSGLDESVRKSAQSYQPISSFLN